MMKLLQFFSLCLALAISFGCNSNNKNIEIASKKDPVISGIDLSTLTPEEAIKTKFSTLILNCSNEITAIIRDGAILHNDTKIATYNWNILEETTLEKEMNFKNSHRNIHFQLVSKLVISHDSAFNVSISGTPGVMTDTTVFTSTATSVTTGGNQFNLYPSESFKVFETSFWPSESEEKK